MKFPSIPQNPKNWEIDNINELIKYPNIESETFDFKKEPSELDEHICAMANTMGGILVLGISQVKSKDGKRIIRFKKSGFLKGKEETILNQIVDNTFKVDPLPEIDVEHVHEKDNKK